MRNETKGCRPSVVGTTVDNRMGASRSPSNRESNRNTPIRTSKHMWQFASLRSIERRESAPAKLLISQFSQLKELTATIEADQNSDSNSNRDSK